MSDLVILKALRDKLKGGNSWSIHLNVLPGRFATRLDLANLNDIQPNIVNSIIMRRFVNKKVHKLKRNAPI